MKRRSFLATLAGIIAAPFVAKKAVAETPAVKPYTVAVDWESTPVVMSYRVGIDPASPEPDQHCASLWKVGYNGDAKIIARWDATKETLPAWRKRMAKFELMGPRP